MLLALASVHQVRCFGRWIDAYIFDDKVVVCVQGYNGIRYFIIWYFDCGVVLKCG